MRQRHINQLAVDVWQQQVASPHLPPPSAARRQRPTSALAPLQAADFTPHLSRKPSHTMDPPKVEPGMEPEYEPLVATPGVRADSFSVQSSKRWSNDFCGERKRVPKALL